MDSLNNDTCQQLVEQITIMNLNLEAASFAINNLTMQLSSHETVSSILPQTGSENHTTTNSAQAAPCIDTATHGDQENRTLGYVNWDTSLGIKNLHLVQMAYIRDALKNLKNISTATKSISTNGQQISRCRHDYDEEYEDEDYEGDRRHNKNKTTGNGLFSFNDPVPVVGKENRFPQDAVYLDINSPQVKEEIFFLSKLFVPPTDGVIDRFLKIAEKEMQTCGSFEKQYGLKWV